MNKIPSFTVDHEKLVPGLYVSRCDAIGEEYVTTFDIRIMKPNCDKPMQTAGIHTLEHLGATILRDSARKNEVVYFGPMGCRTGFYLIMKGKLDPEDVWPLVNYTFWRIVEHKGDIPGATPKECGNYKDQDLGQAKKYAKKYIREFLDKGMPNSSQMIYPE